MIDLFRGEHRFLSNFWPAEVAFDGRKYPSVEHAYQAAKTINPRERRTIRLCATPGKAKRAGKRIQMRSDWEIVKLGIMEHLVRQKFYNHESLKFKLLATGTQELIEGNTWGDTFWGVCKGKGKNHLGKIIMKIREELKS